MKEGDEQDIQDGEEKKPWRSDRGVIREMLLDVFEFTLDPFFTGVTGVLAPAIVWIVCRCWAFSDGR